MRGTIPDIATEPGRRNKRIAVESRSESGISESGEISYAWTTFASRWAEITDESSREVMYAKQINSLCSHIVKFPYVTGLLPDMRINYGGRYFYINSITNPDQRKIEHRVECQELVQ